jgi:hypothetical protein
LNGKNFKKKTQWWNKQCSKCKNKDTLADKGGSFAKTTIAKEDKRYKSRTIGDQKSKKCPFISAIQISKEIKQSLQS